MLLYYLPVAAAPVAAACVSCSGCHASIARYLSMYLWIRISKAHLPLRRSRLAAAAANAVHPKDASTTASSVPKQPLTKADAERLKTEGNKAHLKARYAEAVQKYTQAIEACPTDHVFWANRAASYLELNEAEKALTDAIESARLEPRYVKAHFRQGLALLRLGRGAEAVAALERAMAIDPTAPQLATSLAEAKELAAKQAAAATARAAAVSTPSGSRRRATSTLRVLHGIRNGYSQGTSSQCKTPPAQLLLLSCRWPRRRNGPAARGTAPPRESASALQSSP
jgi:tetratricopeptide (TPR) repeat protein